MILIISSGGAHVEDADDLHGLSVRRLDGASVDASLAKPTEAGTHCWIVIDRLRELAATGQPADWGERFDAMITYANRKGWVDEESGCVRAHLTPAAPE
jgi:hypothetical protein